MIKHTLPTLGLTLNPVNAQDISIQVNHDQQSVIDQPAPHVQVNNLYFSLSDVAKIMSYVNTHGITEGLPYNIEIKEKRQTEIISMYLDLMDGFKKSKDGITASVKMIQSLDWLDDKVDGFTFESMYNETGVKRFVIDGVTYDSFQQFIDAKRVYIPYIISSIPNYQDAFMAIFGMTYIGVELYKITQDILASIKALASNPLQWGEIARITVLVLMATLLLTTLIALLNQLVNCLIQPVKYHAGMLMSDLLKLVSVKMGLEADSSMYNTYPFNQLAYLPEKYSPVENSKNVFKVMGFDVGGFAAKGYTLDAVNAQSVRTSVVHDSQTPDILHGYPNGTGGDFLRLAKSIPNGKITIPDQQDKLVLERRDNVNPSTLYKLTSVRADWSEFNTDELPANLVIKFRTDLNDKNSIDKYSGTILQATHKQISTNNERLVTLKGIREVNIEAARGVAKTDFTFIENVIADIVRIWGDVGDVAIVVGDIIADIVIGVVNSVIVVLNLVMDIIHVIISAVNAIIDFLDSFGFSISHVSNFSWNPIPTIEAPAPFQFQNPDRNDHFSDRLNTLLLENDMVDTPKLLLVDTQRAEFQSNRIAYLHKDNSTIVNAQYLFDNYYCIDMFCDTPDAKNGNKLVNNRYTKITPALNKPDDKNKVVLSLRDFKNLVDNPQFLDNHGEPALADSILWYIEKNGAAEFAYRVPGWRIDPQNPNKVKRSKEIAVNLQLKTSLANGQ